MPRSTTAENTPLLLRGSVLKVRRTCGKTGCKCARKELHETWALSYSRQGRTHMIPLRPEDVPVARQAVRRYQQTLARLESRAMLGIHRLHASITAAKRRTR